MNEVHACAMTGALVLILMLASTPLPGGARWQFPYEPESPVTGVPGCHATCTVEARRLSTAPRQASTTGSIRRIGSGRGPAGVGRVVSMPGTRCDAHGPARFLDRPIQPTPRRSAPAARHRLPHLSVYAQHHERSSAPPKGMITAAPA
jgi:hypothetical protein